MKLSQSEIDLIKQRDIVSYLDACGFKPVRRHNGKAIKYISPLRAETDGSFYAYPETGTWYDFGSGKGGSIIQLCMEMNGVSFGKACDILSGGKLPERKIED